VSFALIFFSVPFSHSAYSNGAAPRKCNFDSSADYDDHDMRNSAVTSGTCECSGNATSIGLSPHSDTIHISLLQQQGIADELVTCAPDMHSLISNCSEDAPVVESTINM
jgi:hypothetical protein